MVYIVFKREPGGGSQRTEGRDERGVEGARVDKTFLDEHGRIAERITMDLAPLAMISPESKRSRADFGAGLVAIPVVPRPDHQVNRQAPEFQLWAFCYTALGARDDR